MNGIAGMNTNLVSSATILTTAVCAMIWLVAMSLLGCHIARSQEI